MAWMSRILFSTSVKSTKSCSSAWAASSAFWAWRSNRVKNSLFFGSRDSRISSSFGWTRGSPGSARAGLCVMVPRGRGTERRWHGVCFSGRQPGSPGAKKEDTMVLFAIGLMAGVAIGMIIVGFLAIGAYDRGFTDALQRRKAWRTELVARTVVGTRALAATRKAS